MELSYSELIHYSVKLLGDYESCDHLTFEQFINEQFKDDKYLDDVDYTFIVEVLSGCVRYSKLLDIAINGFLNSGGKNSLMNDIYTYKVFEYLVLFRLEELTVPNFFKFISSVNSKNLTNFLRYLSDEGKIMQCFKKGWISIYDEEFIETKIISPLFSRLVDIKSSLETLGINKDDKKSSFLRKKIVSKPFNLTPSKPPPSFVTPEPLSTPQAISFYRPIPASTYVQNGQNERLKEIKQTNWQKAMALHSEMSELAPSCARPSKSEKTLQKLENLLAQENYRPQIQRKSYQPPSLDPVPIKLNTAAILREGKVYKKKEEEFLRKLEELEHGGGDMRFYEERQMKLRLEEEMKRDEEIQMNVLMGKLSKEEAIVAKKRSVAENKEKADEMRKEASRLMQEYMMNKLQEDDENRQLIERVQSTHEDAKEAKKKIIAYKSQIVQNIQECYKELMRNALEEAEQEMQKRLELIREIREMESNRQLFQKTVDLTQVGSHRLLCEMSILELRERLKMAEEEEKELWLARNMEIQSNKQIKNQMLQDLVEKISHHRNENSLMAIKRSEERKNIEVERRQQPVNSNILQMQKRLEELKAERKAENNNSKNNNKVPNKKPNENTTQVTKKNMDSKNKNESNNLTTTSTSGSRVALLAL